MELDNLTDAQIIEISERAEKIRAKAKEDAEHAALVAHQLARDAKAEAERQAEAQVVADRQLERDKQTLIRPETLAGYQTGLSAAQKVSYIGAYGADFPRLLAAKEKSGLSWTDYDKVNAEATKRQQERAGITPAQEQGNMYEAARRIAEVKAQNRSFYDLMMADEKRAARVRFGLPEEE